MRQNNKQDNYIISIAMCTYNGERFLQEQLDSFLNQSRLPDELIICDDGSGDSTISIIEDFAQKAPFQVNIYINEHNIGFSKNFEKAISLCQGDIILPSDQDDVWLPQKIARMEQVFRDRPEIDCVFCDCEMVNDKMQSLKYTQFESKGFNKRQQNRVANSKSFQVFLKISPAQGCTLAFRAKWCEILLPLPNSWAFDDWIGVVLSAFGRVGFILEPLVKYRQHELQVTNTLRQMSFEPYYAGKKKGFFERLSKGRERRNDIVSKDIERFKEALNWFLFNNVKLYGNSFFIISLIEDKINHLITRIEMPNLLRRRLPYIWKEIANGHYFRYSRGWRSAMKDFLLKP